MAARALVCVCASSDRARGHIEFLCCPGAASHFLPLVVERRPLINIDTRGWRRALVVAAAPLHWTCPAIGRRTPHEWLAGWLALQSAASQLEPAPIGRRAGLTSVGQIKIDCGCQRRAQRSTLN